MLTIVTKMTIIVCKKGCDGMDESKLTYILEKIIQNSEYEETQEERQEHWLQFQQRLREKGIWREDD